MSKDIRLKLGLRIKQLRKRYRYTQEKLSELAEVDYKHIQLLESRKPPAIKIDTLEKIAKAFNMSVSKLLDFS